MDGFTVISDRLAACGDAPRQSDLDRCVHCGLCLQACPTYRELGVEMDSPRGRIYQMAQVAEGASLSDAYREHIDLCLACRACETACPSGVQYGRLIEAARAQIEASAERPRLVRWLRWFVFHKLLPSPALLTVAGSALWLYRASCMQAVLRATGILKLLGLANLEALTPPAEPPFFFGKFGRTFPAIGVQKRRVAMLAGCIGSVSFARLNEATVRVLQRNGCEVVVPAGQTCCGALAVHAGERGEGRALARRNIDAVLDGGFNAVISNAAGCGSTLKEYHELLEHDPEYAEKARRFVALVKDVNEFLALEPLNPQMGEFRARVTYQDSCHLAHGQKITRAPRKLLAQVPGLDFQEMRGADLCCGSAGIYNVVQNRMAMQILDSKMSSVNAVAPDVIVTANPGCMLQLEAGVKLHPGPGGKIARVMHVVELLDAAYRSTPDFTRPFPPPPH